MVFVISVVVMLVNIIVVVVVFVNNVLVDIAMSSKTLVGAPFATAHTTPRSPRQENDTTAKNPYIVQLLLKTRLFDSNKKGDWGRFKGSYNTSSSMSRYSQGAVCCFR